MHAPLTGYWCAQTMHNGLNIFKDTMNEGNSWKWTTDTPCLIKLVVINYITMSRYGIRGKDFELESRGVLVQ